MNKIYKVIWNRVRHCYVVVSEIAKNHGKEHSTNLRVSKGLCALTLAIGLSLSSYAFAADGNTTTNQGVDSTQVKADLGNSASAAYDKNGNLTIGNTGTIAEGTKAQGKNNTAIGTDTDTLRNVTEGETTKNGQPMDTDTNKKLVDGEGQAHNLDTSTESGGSTAVGYNNKAEGDNSTAIGNNAKITNKPVTYYADADGNKTTDAEKAAWYKDSSGNPTQVPQVFRDASDNTTTTAQYVHTYTEKDPTTGKEITKTEITSDAAKADQKDGKPVYNYRKSDNLDKLYSVTLYQAASNSIAAGSSVTANGNNAVAVGYSSTADNSAVAVGDTAVAKENAVAIGKKTKASVEGSIALGKGSQADRSGGITGWDPKTGTTSTQSGLAWKSTEGALSIGNGSISRQITGVVAGSEDTDAVNLAQLKKAMTHYYSVKTTEDTDAAGNNNYLNDGATGDNALAAGVRAVAPGDNATAVGTSANATASQATAIGNSASATSSQSTAIGNSAGAHGDYATALGNSANASSTYATAIGAGTIAPYSQSTAVGASANATNSQATAMGSSASATSSQSTAIGNNAGAHGDSATALGNGASATNKQATAIGSGAAASGADAIAMGNGSSSTDSSTIAIGSGAGAHGDYATALGSGASATSYEATAIGSGAAANGSYAIAMGNGSSSTDSSTIAIGSGAGAHSSSAIALGSGASANSSYVIAIGNGASAQNGDYGIAIGSSASTQYGEGTALGHNAKTTAPNGTALGSGASANYHALALGNNATASQSYALAAGDGASAQDYYAIALGYNAKSNVNGGIALGSNSTAYRASGTTGLDPRTGKAYTDTSDKTWNSTYGALSIGNVDSDGTVNGTRQIIGVAAGTNDTDAVNVAQLKAAMNQSGSIHDYSVNSTDTANDTNYSNAGATGKNALAAGVSASATAENAVAIGYGAKAEGVGATVIGQYGTATGQYALAFGGSNTDSTGTPVDNTASGSNSVAFGERTAASGNNSTAFGWQTKATEKRATAFGERTTASGANSTAFGQLAVASGQNSTAFGNETVANNYGSTAFGNRTEALGAYSTAFGNSTVAAGMNTVAFGTDNVAGAVLDGNGAYTNIIYQTNPKNGRVVKDANGNPIELSREKMDARGNLAYTDSNGNTKSVTYTVSGGETHSYVLLQGEDGNTYIRDYRGNIRSASIGADGTVTVGDTAPTNVTLKKANAGANGYNILSNANATVWGENSIASGEASTAFGIDSTASGKNSLAALGGTASAENAAAIGNGAKATLADSVALGSGALANRASGSKGYDVLTGKASSNTSAAWVANANAIAIGNDTEGSLMTRQITGVAAGSLDTDAVNVAQLKAAGFKVTTQKNGAISSSILNGDTLDFEGENNAIVSTTKDSRIITVAVSKTPTFDSATFYNPNPAAGQNNEKVTIANGQISAFNPSEQKRAVIGVDNEGNGSLSLVNNDLSTVQVYTQNSADQGNDGITRMYYVSSSGNGGEIKGVHTIAVLDDGINYTGDNLQPGTTDKVVVKHKLNSTMDVTGGADTSNLSEGNIGVVATPAVEDDQGNLTQKAKLEIKLNKDLQDLNSVTAGNVRIGNNPANTLQLTEKGQVTENTAPAGNYATGLDNKAWDTKNPSYVSGRAATEDQLAIVSGVVDKGLSFTTNTKDATNTTDNYTGYKVVNRQLGDTISIKAGDADPNMKYEKKNLTSQIAENGDITISMADKPTFSEVTANSFNLSPKDMTTKDQAGNTASAQLNAHYRDASLNPKKNVTMADGSTGMVRLHYHDGEGTVHDLATMDDGQIYAGDIKEDGTEDTTGFGRKMNEKTTINGGVKDKDNLTDNNIGVVSNSKDTLTVKLAKELKDLTSVTTGKTVLNDSGITITNDAHDPNKTVAVKGDEVTFGGNQVTNMGSGADDKDDKGNPTYNILTNGANIGDVKNIANSITDAAKLTGDSNITVTYNDATADGKNTVTLNDSITLGSDADKKVTIDGTAGTIKAGDKVSLNGNTGTGSIGGVTIGNQTGVATTKTDGGKAKTEDGTFVTGLTNKVWNPDVNGIVSGRAATEDQLKTVSDTVNAGWELDVNGSKQKDVTPTSRKVNFKQGQNIIISGSGDDVTVATDDTVRFTTINVTGDKDDSGSYTGGITIGKQSGGNSANPGPGYYITGLDNTSWNSDQIQSGRAATEDQLKQVAEDIKHGTVDGDKYITGGDATYEENGKGSAKLTGTNGLEGTISNLHDYYVTKGEVSDDGKKLTMTKNDGTTFDINLDKVMQSDMRLVKNPGSADGAYTVNSNGDLTLTVQDANGTEATKQTITLSGLASKAKVDKGLNFAANSGTAYNAKLGGKVTIKGSNAKDGHNYSEENVTTEVDASGNITIKLDKDMTANTVTVSGKDGKDGQIGITGKDGADGMVTTIIKTIGKNGIDGKNGTPGVNGTDGITRIVYQDGKDGETGTTTHTVATLDDGLKFGANTPVVGKTANPVGNKLNSIINIKGAGTKELDKYSGQNLLTSVEQADDGTTTINVLMDKNISADSVVVGQEGKAGKDGKDGYIGINGKDGADGITTTLIRTEKGQPGEKGATGKSGVDGTDITRIVYQNDQDKVDGKNGSHTVATLDDGLKFSGDDNRVITKKLNEQLQFVGGADKSKLTQNNIGINELEDGKLTIQLVNTPNLGDKGNLKAGDAQIGWFNGDVLTKTDGTKEKQGSYATGLDNKDWNISNPSYVSGRAATEDQLAKVSVAINNATTAAGKRTVVTVNDKANPAEATPRDGDYGDYDSTNGNLMIAAKKDVDGVLTYNIKLNDNLAIGQKGENGKDGKVTVDTKGGTTVVIGHDGKDGENGRDGISVKGKDGKDGVTISVSNGKDGKDGSEGHIGLTGPAGKDVSADIHVKNGQNGVDGTDGNNGKDGMDRIVYEDHNGKLHEVATMDDGLKIGANAASKEKAANPVSNKLNSTINIMGSAAKTGHTYTDDNLTTTVEQDKDGNTTVKVLMDKDITGNSVTVGEKGESGTPGKDGVDGTIGVNGKDGSSVVIKGTDGISINGKDGQNGVTIKGVDGKAGTEGHIGLTGSKGPKGADGKDGQNASADIHVVNGHVGVDGTDGNKGTNGMDRVVYEDHNHITHEVATMDDGQKYAGDVRDSNATANAFSRKLNEQTNVVGGVTNLDDLSTGNNVGVVSNGTDTLTIRLAKKLTDLTSVTTVKTDDKGNKTSETVQDGNGITITPSTLGDGKSAVSLTDKGLSNGGNQITHVDSGLKDAAGNKVELKDATGDVLNNAVNVGDLKNVQNAVTSAHTAVTVNGGVGAPDAGANGAFGDYTKEDKGNLLLAQKKDTNTNQITYDLKLNDKVALGKAGVDGSIGLTGADGKSSVGLNGKDGISVIGKDGKNGVSITGSNGLNGKNGIDGKIVIGTPGKDAVSISGKDGVGHIGLTGPKGEKGADGTDGRDGISIDITTDLKTATLDDGKNVKTVIKDKDGKETTITQAPRIQYESNGKNYEVATMDDGLKFVGNDGQEVIRKLNTTLSIKGGITDATALKNASAKNLGVRQNADKDGLEIIMTDTPDFTKVTVGGDKKITIGGQANTDTKNPANGNYITGLDNTKWDKDHVTENRAATEGQLRDVAGSITNQQQGGGFALTSDEKGADKIVKQDLGKAIQIKGDTTYKTDGTVEKAGNIKTSIDNGAIKVELNKDVDLTKDGSIKAGETTINKGGVDTNKVTIKDSTISISKDGINGGDKQITNVASGASEIIKDADGKVSYKYDNETNAANIGDVKRIAGNMKTEITNNVTDVTNKVNKMGDELTQVQKDVKADRTYQGDDGAAKKVNVKFGSFLSLTGGAKLADLTEEGNIGVVQKEIDDPDKGEKIAGLSVRLAKHLNLEKTTYTSNENGQTYTSEIDGKGLTIKTGDKNRNITVQDGNVNMGGNQIHNVAPGQTPGDAVNVGQLNATNQTVANLGGAVNKLGTRVNRVGAGAAALAALHPLDFDPDDKWDFAAGYGNYKDASAVAVGAYYRPNEDTMFSVGGSFGGGENMVNAGVSFKVGQGNHVSTSRVAMAKEIKDLRQDVANLNAIVNRQSALIDKLTGTNAGTIQDTGNDLFPDVPANHWAYEYVTKLKQAGILTGYPDGNFDGDRMMTRYEFAAIVYRAIMAGAASNPALSQDGTLDKLAKEFSPEMKHIRIDTIAKDKNGKPTIERVRVIPEAQQ
jgi:hypothetical protein